MKRDPRLQGLSSDHHRALVVARQIERTASAFSIADADTLRKTFDRELEPHFRIEERVLLSALEPTHPALVARTHHDHAFLRREADASADWDASRALAWAARLRDHVRFEERELFPACEAMLDESVLNEVRRLAPPPKAS